MRRLAAVSARRAGFSLPEVLVVMVILAIASGLVALTFKAAIDSRNVSLARIDIMEKGRATLDLMARELQSAFINELGYLTNSYDVNGEFCRDRPCEDIRVDPGTGGYCIPEGLDWFEMTNTIPREVPGTGIDEDGDGLIDEIQMRFTGKPGLRANGIDDDGDGLTDEDGALPYTGIDDDGDGLTDEDGWYPADMVNFAVSRSREEERVYDLAEIGYSIGTRTADGEDHSSFILRRFEGLSRDDDLAIPVDGQFIRIDDRTGIGYDASETDFTVYFVGSDPNNNVDILSFDTVGLRFTYWYFNYAIAQELEPYGGDWTLIGRTGVPVVDIDNDGDGQRDNEDPINGLDDDGDGRIDEDPSPDPDDPGIRQGPWQKVRSWESSLERYPNEKEDVNIDQAYVDVGEECHPARIQAIEHMDGLPDMVEIEIWVFDQERRELSPRHLSTMVSIPMGRPQ